jgi:hypothetical protein
MGRWGERAMGRFGEWANMRRRARGIETDEEKPLVIRVNP